MNDKDKKEIEEFHKLVEQLPKNNFMKKIITIEILKNISADVGCILEILIKNKLTTDEEFLELRKNFFKKLKEEKDFFNKLKKGV